MKIILLELNEVPHKVFTDFISTDLGGRYSSSYCLTRTLDSGSLSPWVTWESVHRGAYNNDHSLNDINQPSELADLHYPTVFDVLNSFGKSVGIMNTMNSGRLALQQPRWLSFFVPEAFSTTSFCLPYSLSDFQSLNLYFSRKSARVVSTQIPSFPILFKAIISYLRTSRRIRSLRIVFLQFISEILSPWKKVRRRIVQSDLMFDLFISLLESKKPDLSVFFTNHVASSMHRFWEATYPDDFPNQVADDHWLLKYRNEIPVSMRSTSHYIDSLVNFVDSHNDTQLWIVSGLGQAAVPEHNPLDYYWHIHDLTAYIESCVGYKPCEIIELPQMLPIYSFSCDSQSLLNDFVAFAENNSGLSIRSVSESTLAFKLNWKDPRVSIGDNTFLPEGLKKMPNDERSTSAAYHIPFGTFLRYGPELSELPANCFDNDNYLLIHNIKQLLLDAILSN